MAVEGDKSLLAKGCKGRAHMPLCPESVIIHSRVGKAALCWHCIDKNKRPMFIAQGLATQRKSLRGH